MGLQDLPGPAKVFVGMFMWGVILWLFTLNNPSFVPIAKFLFLVLVVPNGVVEWLKDKNIVRGRLVLFTRLALVIAAGVIWYFYYR